MSGKPWFRAKRYGFGAGPPVAWQGWLALGLFAGIVAGAAAGARRAPVVSLAVIALASAGFALIASIRSDRPWRWRWGGD